jgi:hypothetical protein
MGASASVPVRLIKPPASLDSRHCHTSAPHTDPETYSGLPPIPSRYSPAAAQCAVADEMTRCLDRDQGCLGVQATDPVLWFAGEYCEDVGERAYKDVWVPGSRQSSHNTHHET